MKKKVIVCMLLPLLLLTGCTSGSGTQGKKTEWIQESDKVQFEDMCVEAIDTTIKNQSKDTISLSSVKSRTKDILSLATLKNEAEGPVKVKESSCRAYYNDEYKDVIVIGANASFQFDLIQQSHLWDNVYFATGTGSYSTSWPSMSFSLYTKTMYNNKDYIIAVFKKENNSYKIDKFITSKEVEKGDYFAYQHTAEQGKKIDVPIQSRIEEAVK